MKDFECFKQKAYSFYPKNISAIKNQTQYLNSEENKRLDNVFQNPDLTLLRKVDELKDFFKSSCKKNIYDFTIQSWQDRAYNIQFILNKKENKTFILCVNISMLIPFYLCYIIEVEFDSIKNKLKCSPKINLELEKSIFNNDLMKSKLFIENILKYKEIRFEVLDSKITDLSFQDIELGDFTLFNAFFLNNIYTQIF
jgi:hypothetical protein